MTAPADLLEPEPTTGDAERVRWPEPPPLPPGVGTPVQGTLDGVEYVGSALQEVLW